MKKLMIISLMLLSCTAIYAAKPKTNLDKLSEKKRTEYLLAVTKAAILKYAPGWYRDVGGYKIERIEHTDKKDIEQYGKFSYKVTRYCDTEKEVFEWGFSTQVYVNGETGKVTDIMFGVGNGWGGMDKPELFDHVPFKKFIEGVSSKKK